MGGAGTHHDRIDVHYLDKVLPSTFGNSDHQLRVTCWMNQQLQTVRGCMAMGATLGRWQWAEGYAQATKQDCDDDDDEENEKEGEEEGGDFACGKGLTRGLMRGCGRGGWGVSIGGIERGKG